jgi:HEAT repeat protein
MRRERENASKKARAGVRERTLAVSNLQMEDRPHLQASLRRYLRDRSPWVRAEALDMVKKADMGELEAEVLGLLSDSNSIVRMSAAECIGSLLDGEKTEAHWLYPLLEDRNLLVRVETLESLAYIGDKKSLPLIVLRLKDEEPLVRSYAATAISDLNGKKHLKALEHASKQECDELAKIGFACALFKFGDSHQLSWLIEQLASCNYLVRCAAANNITTLSLSRVQVKCVRAAVTHAASFPIDRADGSTMERVLEELSGDYKTDDSQPK